MRLMTHTLNGKASFSPVVDPTCLHNIHVLNAFMNA